MPKTKEQKQKIIEELKEKIATQKSIVLVDFAGLDSKALFQLREQLKKAGCLLQVVKKTLLQKVLEGQIPQIKGQLALAFGFEDEVSPAKICYQFSVSNAALKILGGILGKEFLEPERVIGLAQIPSRPELLARLVGSLSASISNFVYILRGNLNNLVYILSQLKVSNNQ